ncbi:MAG: hypothetical protein IIB57_12135 [Planctomycetes bacterium]|nr:hypothetical protein [Planctomycetota bacterium]
MLQRVLWTNYRADVLNTSALNHAVIPKQENVSAPRRAIISLWKISKPWA